MTITRRYAANEAGTVGTVQVVRNAGKQGKVFVFGIDGTEQLANFLLGSDAVLQSVTAQQPFLMGSMAVKIAVDAIAAKPVEKKVVVPIIGLSCDDPATVKKFLADLKTLQ